MWEHGLTYERVTADALVCRGPCVFVGAVILASVAGGDASIYDGHEATSGNKVLTLKGDANISNAIAPPVPIRFGNGLFVDIGANCDEVTVFYSPLGELNFTEYAREQYARGVAAASGEETG